MSLTSTLEAGRRDFLEATADLTPQQASTKPSPNAWSVLECIEHVVTVEHRFLGWIANGAEITPQRNGDNELRLFTMIRNRETKVEAPEVVRPTGRFTNLSDALAEFNAARDRSVEVITSHGEKLYALGAKHPRFGDLNGAEVFHVIDGHARRHAEQIRETVESLALRL
ncbi:MAG: DinB family protein [Acidobacteriota bacterium]